MLNPLVDQFDQMRKGMLGGLTPFQLPEPAPEPIQFGGNLPGQAGGFAMPTGGSPSRGGGGGGSRPAPAPPPSRGGGGSVASRFGALDQNFGGRLRKTSGYRDPAHNARVGGVPNSWHTKKDEFGHERARDFVGDARSMQEGAAWARANGAQEVLVHNVGSGQHLHVAFLMTASPPLHSSTTWRAWWMPTA